MPLLGFKSGGSKIETVRGKLNSGTVKARIQSLGIAVPQKVMKEKTQVAKPMTEKEVAAEAADLEALMAKIANL